MCGGQFCAARLRLALGTLALRLAQRQGGLAVLHHLSAEAGERLRLRGGAQRVTLGVQRRILRQALCGELRLLAR